MTISLSHRFAPVMEALEDRLLLSGTAPAFTTDLASSYVLSTDGALTIPVDAQDADGNAVTITATSSDGGLIAVARQGDPYAVLHFTQADSTPIGDIVVQLFSDSYQAAVDQFVTLATLHVNDDGTTAAPTVDAPAFYTDVLVHRIYPGFVIQSGDASLGNGYGDSPLPAITDYFDPNLSFAGSGVLAYANSGTGTSDNQFFITAGPTPTLNGGYIIFGQVISGWNTYDALMATPLVDGTVDQPVNPPILTSVDILQPGDQVEQDGTVTLYAGPGFTGSGQVTVTLTDSTGLSTSQVTDVTVAGIAPIADVHAIPGQTVTFTPVITSDGAGGPTAFTAVSDPTGLDITVDPTTHQVSFTVPDYYSGTFHVDLAASFDNLADATQVVTIVSSEFAPALADSYVLSTNQPLDIVVTSQTTLGDPVTVQAQTSTTGILASVSGNTITLSGAAGYAGTGQLTVLLTDDSGLYETQTVDVTVAGILQPNEIRTAPGESFSFTPTIVSDGAGGPTGFTATTTQDGVTVAADPTTHLVTVTLPAAYTGTFQIDLAATYAALATSTQSVTVTASGFNVDLAASYVLSTNGPLTIPVATQNAGQTAITVTATTSNSNLVAQVRQNETYAVLHFTDSTGTTVGDILVQLFNDAYPAAVQQFITLATKHVNSDGTTADPTTDAPAFYTNVKVHRIYPGFVIQTGDAVNGDGTGDSPLAALSDYFAPNLSFAGPGVLAYANSGTGTSDNQFFITDAGTPDLDGGYIIFGQLITGWDTYDALMATPLVDGTVDQPVNAPILTSVDIFEPGQYTEQNATITLYAINGFVGEADVTVTLSDGSGASESQTSAVTVAGIGAQADIHTGAGQAFTFTPTIVSDGAGGPTALTATTDLTGATATTDLTGATATVDATTHLVSVTLPASYTGTFQITLSATFDSLATSTRTVTVFTQTSYDPTGVWDQHLTTGGTAEAIVQVGTRLYVAAGTTGLEVYDLTNPAAPTLLGTFDTLGYARDVVVSGTTAFVADTYGGLLSLNVSDPAHITENDVVGAGSALVGLTLDGTTLLAAAYDQGLVAVNITNPASLAVSGVIKSDTTRTIQYAMDVQTKTYGNKTYAFVSDSDGGVWVINVTNPAAMSFAGGVGTGGSPWGMDLRGNLLYVADQNNGLMVVNVSNATRPVLVGQLSLSNTPWQVSLSADPAITTAMVGTSAGVVFVDITNYKYLYVDYTYTTNSHRSGNVLFTGKQIMLAAGDYGVIDLDATNLLSRATIFGSRTFRVGTNSYNVSVGGGAVARVYPADANFTAVQRLEIVADPKYVQTNREQYYRATGSVNINGRGTWSIDNVVVSGMLNSFNAPVVNLAGSFSSTGAITTVRLNDLLAAPVTMAFNTSSIPFRYNVKMNLTFGRVANTTLNTNGVPIGNLQAVEWLDTDTADTITAPYITTIRTQGKSATRTTTAIAGDFQSNLALTSLNQAQIKGSASGTWTITGSAKTISVGADFAAHLTVPAVQTITVKRDMTSAALDLTLAAAKNVYALRTLTVTGWIKDTTITSAGNIQTLRAGGMNNTTLYAGVSSTTLPAKWDDFSNTCLLGTVAITGIRNGQTWADSFINSKIAAWTINNLTLNYPTLDNSGTEFGATADTIGHLGIRVANTNINYGNLRDWSQSVRLPDLIVRLV